ncbi:anti-sigma factor [Pseudoflavitalea rhizosphaerae]|uniref:anti-sigma factor n=1 Tax=Pseudoflavitalea rhizosphaerae TaxID=1884793 RepID=UPI000F8C5090|nr:anti-sigma factor [Pseudoflavitalea rhizosphaerae]
MSQLENFIRDHREEFDGEEPSPRVWKDLQQQLQADANPAPKKNSGGRVLTLTILKWSAAAAILVLAGLGVFHLIDKPTLSGTASTQSQKDDLLQKINPTYAKEVYHFTQLIELKQEELKQIEKDNPELYQQFLGDISQLDSSYNNLKKELPSNPNREQLLEAMIENLKMQTELLNQQLQIIQQIKQSKTQNHVKSI